MNELQLYLFIFLLLMIIATTAMTIKQMNDIRRLQEARKRPRIVTVEECDGNTSTRDYREGDYVGLVEGQCPGGGPRRIVGIYAIKEEKPRRSPI
ncbi:MAG: hypothetical protein ACP5FT_04425 [Acidilobus sp.]